MDPAEFDFDLPPERIAQHAVEPRDHARLMVVRRGSGTIEHRVFHELPGLLDPGDLLVRNTSRVIPARLIGRRAGTGGKWEALFVQEMPSGAWEVLARTGGHPRPGERIDLDRGGAVVLEDRTAGGRWLVRPDPREAPLAFLEKFGHIPIPPYIRRGLDEPGDRARYQTVYAQAGGSVAAPTAGLHFTPGLFDRLAGRGIGWVDVTLHVGPGTFQPLGEGPIEEHRLEAEWAELTPEAAGRLSDQRARGGRIVAVGTTSTRVLETSAGAGPGFRPLAGPTGLFLRPGHEFRGADALITNFHLPRSSLLVLVSALAGRELIRQAYARAIAEGYRFYSYGDAMLIL